MTNAAAACAPNIATAGRRRREQFGRQWAALALVALAAGVAFRLPWLVRALLVVPAWLSAVGFLQARRSTCLLRVRQGTLERDDFTTEPASAEAVAASRKVAATIQRDALLIGLGAGAIAAATALIR